MLYVSAYVPNLELIPTSPYRKVYPGHLSVSVTDVLCDVTTTSKRKRRKINRMPGKFATLSHSCVGSISKTTKATTDSAWRIRKGDHIVAKEFTVVDEKKKLGTCILIVTEKETDAKAIQIQLVKKTGLSLGERQAALAAARRSTEVTVDMTGLKKIHAASYADVLREGLPPLTVSDLSGSHWAVGKSYDVTNWTHGPGEDADGFTGTLKFTGFDESSGMLDVRFDVLNTTIKFMPIEFAGVIEGFDDEESDPKEKAVDASINMLVISLEDMPNMLILSQRFPGSTPAKGAAVCHVLKLASKLVLPLTTEKLTTELGSSSPSRKRALATEYAAELEAQFRTYCRLTSITTIPVMPAIAAGEDWATSMASWIVTQTNSKRSGGLGDDLPRAGAMQKLSKDAPTWNIFLKRLGAAGALGFTAPEAEQAGPLALARSLDKTLERFGDKADAAAILPAVMTSADKLDADQLMDKFFDLRGTNTTVERESNQGKHEHSRRTTFVGVQAAIDTSGSETEQAARSVTLQAGMSIQDSPQEIKALKAIEDQVSNNDAMKKMIADASPDMQRILLWAENPCQVLSSRIEVQTLNSFACIRGQMAKNFRTTLLGDDAEEPNSKFIKAVDLIRTGMVNKVNLMNLLGEEGAWSMEEPLKAFHALPDGRATFLKAFQVLEQAWILARPLWASQILTFCQRLTTTVSECFKDGGNFLALCPWYRSVMRTVCKPTMLYATRQLNTPGAPPGVHVIKDQGSTWNISLQKAIAAIVQKNISMKTLDELGIGSTTDALSALEKENLALKKRLENLERRREPKREREPKGGGQRKESKKKTEYTKEAADKKADNKEKADNAKGKGSFDGRSRKAQEEHLSNTVGSKGGKDPCLYHFTKGWSCKKTAEECSRHHED